MFNLSYTALLAESNKTIISWLRICSRFGDLITTQCWTQLSVYSSDCVKWRWWWWWFFIKKNSPQFFVLIDPLRKSAESKIDLTSRDTVALDLDLALFPPQENRQQDCRSKEGHERPAHAVNHVIYFESFPQNHLRSVRMGSVGPAWKQLPRSSNKSFETGNLLSSWTAWISGALEFAKFKC